MNQHSQSATFKGAFTLLLLLLLSGWSSASFADAPASGGTSNSPQIGNIMTTDQIREAYFARNALAKVFGPIESGGTDNIQNGSSTGPGTVNHSLSGPVQMWPVPIPTLQSAVPSQRDTGITKNLMKTTGYPVSDTQFQIISRMNDNIEMEQSNDPEKQMWNSTAQGAIQAGSAANSAAGMTANQGQSAIQFQQQFLVNFTSEAGNRWLVIRDQLFIPIAVLLLLPGAVLCQVKAIIAQGSNVLGETSPFEGIFRSIIAIFMIPGTLLVINYGIDVSNSVHFTIADEYSRIFGTNMYADAQCAMYRAFPVNTPNSNANALRPSNATPPAPQGNAIYSTFEALDLDVRQYDPCAGLDKSLVADENQNQNMILARLLTNGANVGLTGTWNVLCAFQEAFLFYLFCMGPIAAALWVWPVKSLRGALGSWCEGVMILCFWSLFWNTVVLLMACFRGVSETGTIIMSALNFLSTIVTQYAFDFVGLVTSGASSGVTQAMNAAATAASSGGGGGGGGGGKQGAAGGSQGGAQGSHAAHARTGQAHNATASKANPLSLTNSSGKPNSGPTALHPQGTPVKPAGNAALNSGVPANGTTGVPLSTSAKSASHIPGQPNDTPKGPQGAPPPLSDASKSGAALHINSDGSFSASLNHSGPATAADKKDLAHQMQQAQDAMKNHDAAALARLAGPGANMHDVNALAQHGFSSMSDAQKSAISNAAAHNGAGLTVDTAHGGLVSSTGVPGASNGGAGGAVPLGVNMPAGSLSEHGLDIGGPGGGPTSVSKDGFTGTAMPLQSGVDYAGANHEQINQLAKENHLDPSQMSMLVGQNGKAEITGPDGKPLANIHDGNLYAQGAGSGTVMMDQNGQWTAASTGTPLSHEGNNWQVAGTQIGFDAQSGNFNMNGQTMSATEFAKNAPDNVIAHMPQPGQPGGGGEFQAPAAPPLDQIPQGVNPQVAFSAQAVGADAPPGGMQGLSGLAQSEGANSYSYATHNGQLYAEANGHQIAHYDAQHQQWVGEGHTPSGGQAVLNQGQFDQSGMAAQATHGQWVDSSNPTHTMAVDGSQHWHQQAASGPVSGYEGGGYITSASGYSNLGDHQGIAAPSAPMAGMDSVQQQSFQQLAASEHLSNPQLSADGHHMVGTDATGHQHVMASEVGGQWAAASHGGNADVVMNNQGQWVAPGSSTPLAAHENANGSVSWSAQAAPEVSYNQTTHNFESGGYSAPAAAVTPDMVSNIHNQHAPDILATAGNAGQQLQSLATQEGAGAVHTQYDSQHHLQALGDNNQVVANYNSSEQRWEAAGSAGQVVQNSAGDWVANNSTVNSLAAQEHAGQVHVQANGHGGFEAVGQNNQVVASTDGSGNWSSPQAQQIADQMHAGQTHLARDSQGYVDSVTANNSVVSTYEPAGGGGGQSAGSWSAGDTNVQHLAQQMHAGPTHISQDAQGHMQAVGSSGQVVANYDSTHNTWTPANDGVQQLAQQMHAGPTHISQDAQGQMQAVGSSGQVVASYDSTHNTWTPANDGVQQLAQQMHAGPVHMAQDAQGHVQAVGQNGAVVANYDASHQRWESANGSVVQDNNHNWVANNQYVNTAQETPVQYNPQPGGSTTSYDASSYSGTTNSYDQSQSQGTWSAQAAPELTLNNGTFSTTYGDGSAALSMPANNVTPDLVNYVHQNPQQIEGLQNLAHNENLPGSIQLQPGAGGVQAVADGQAFAQNDGRGWMAENNTPQPQQIIERNDGAWVNQDASHSVAHTAQNHALEPQAEPQMHSSPPTSQHVNPTIAASSTGFGAGAAALGAWGALKKQNSMNTPPSTPKPAEPHVPSGPEATAQNKSLTPQESKAREESEKKKREALAELLRQKGLPGSDQSK